MYTRNYCCAFDNKLKSCLNHEFDNVKCFTRKFDLNYVCILELYNCNKTLSIFEICVDAIFYCIFNTVLCI